MSTSRRTILRAMLMLVVSALFAAGATRSAQAMRHLKLVRSSPAADTVLATSPDAIRLWMSEPTVAKVSKIRLTTATGVAIALGALTRDATKDAPLVATIPTPLNAGRYTVTWKAMSKDGHVVNGVFAFRVDVAK